MQRLISLTYILLSTIVVIKKIIKNYLARIRDERKVVDTQIYIDKIELTINLKITNNIIHIFPVILILK